MPLYTTVSGGASQLSSVKSPTERTALMLDKEDSLKTEIQAIFNSSIPLIITFLLEYSLTVACVFSAGNIGSEELGAVTLSNLLANVSSYGVIQGVASALSTLCPQAYGRNDLHAVGLHSMRCFTILCVIFCPIYILWVYGSYPVLYYAIGDEQVCQLASKYLSIMVYGVPGFIIFEVLKLYLQAQGIFHASTYTLFVCAPLNVILNYVLVSKIGFIGAPISIVISNYLMSFMLLAYTVMVDGYQCWCGFSMDIFKSWSQILSLAGPGVLMIEGEWLAFEIISFASSKFGVDSLAAQSIISTICVTVYQIPFAISVATSTRVAWYIGAMDKTHAITATKAALFIAFTFGCLDAITLAVFKGFIAGLFSNDPNVIKIASKVLIIGAIYQVADSVSCVCGGILRGQGRQYIGGWLNIISYYVLALPIAFLCGFYFELELFGLWLGMIAALLFSALFGTIVVVKTDWDHVIHKCQQDGVGNLGIVDTQSIYSNEFQDPSDLLSV